MASVLSEAMSTICANVGLFSIAIFLTKSSSKLSKNSSTITFNLTMIWGLIFNFNFELWKPIFSQNCTCVKKGHMHYAIGTMLKGSGKLVRFKKSKQRSGRTKLRTLFLHISAVNLKKIYTMTSSTLEEVWKYRRSFATNIWCSLTYTSTIPNNFAVWL